MLVKTLSLRLSDRAVREIVRMLDDLHLIFREDDWILSLVLPGVVPKDLDNVETD